MGERHIVVRREIRELNRTPREIFEVFDNLKDEFVYGQIWDSRDRAIDAIKRLKEKARG